MQEREIGTRDKERRRGVWAGYAVLVLLLLVLPGARLLLDRLSFAAFAGRALAFLFILGLHWLLARPALGSRAPLSWRAAPYLWLGLPVLLVLVWELAAQT